MAKWQRAEKDDPTCPLCHKRMEVLVKTEYEGGRDIEYVEAERCRPCGWEWRDGRARRI